MTVTDPFGQRWRVRRRWLPWRRRLHGVEGPAFLRDLPLGDDPVSAVLGMVAFLLVLPLLLVLVLAGIELLLLALLLPWVLLGRVALGRHWTVEARRGWTPVWEMEAGDWRASTQKIEDVAAAIEKGLLPPSTLAR